MSIWIFRFKTCKKILKDNHRVTVVDNMTYNNYDTIPKNENFEFVDDDIANIKKHIDSIPTIERIFYYISPRLCDINNDDVVEEELQRLERTGFYLEIQLHMIEDFILLKL